MLSAIAKKVINYNKAKTALLSYEDVVNRLLRLLNKCDSFRDPQDPIIEYYKKYIQQYLNNVGDPFQSCHRFPTSKVFEVELLQHFAALYSLEKDNIGGYIEWDFPRSELFVMNVTLTRFEETPIYFLRSGSNRRISSQMTVFNIPLDHIKWIDSDPSHGGMDLKKLKDELLCYKESTPIVLWLSLGDVNGSVDNLNDVQHIVKTRENIHIHYSCSNLGVMMPYLGLNKFGINFDNGLDSLAFPLSDFFGVPISGGIILTRRDFSDMCSTEVAVVKEKDSTIGGSRNGHLQLLLWISLQARGEQGIREEIDRVQRNCKYLRKVLELHGINVSTDPFFSCIFLETTSIPVIKNWNLQKASTSENAYKFEMLPHHSKAKLDAFLEEFLGEPPQHKVDSKDSIPDESTKIYRLTNSDRLRLDNYSEELKELSRSILGYPVNLSFSEKYMKDILEILEFNITLNSVQDLKKDLLSYTTGLLRIPMDELFSVTTSGGSFSNLIGFLIARVYLKDPVIYVSQDAHYSVVKSAKIIRTKCVVIKSQDSGELDYDDLEKQIKNNHPRPVIVSLNIGSTMKGAIDSIKKTKALFEKLKLTKFHIHCDAALDGGYLPLVNDSPQTGFDMGIDSLAISTHKYLGVPMPCSIFLTRKRLMTPESLQMIEDIFSVKDGIITALSWYAINYHRTIPAGTEARQLLGMAEYLLEKLKEISYPAWKNDHSNIVFFKKPSDDLIEKWKLATVEDLSHIVVMQHIDYDKLNCFLEDLKKELPVSS